MRAARVEQLPEGWLGKSHACHVGATLATGDWLLFADADCWLKPDVIARALRVAGRESADHITLTPGVAAATLGAQAWHLAFLGSLANWISGVNRGRPGAHLGIGAFNLVLTSAYRACGGYEALRLTIVDDIKLGLLLHRAGKRTRAFIGGADVECHWGTTVPSMIKIMEKNYFAAVDFRLAPVVAGAMVFTLIYATSIIGVWAGTGPGIAAGLALWSLTLPAAVFARRLGWPPARAVITPLSVPAPVLRCRELGRRHASARRRPVARDVLFAGHLAQRQRAVKRSRLTAVDVYTGTHLCWHVAPGLQSRPGGSEDPALHLLEVISGVERAPGDWAGAFEQSLPRPPVDDRLPQVESERTL